VSVRLRLDLSYDGGGFAGWARQPGQRTVQGVLEEAFQRFPAAPVSGLVVAGRTDAGVHASGQVAHVDLAGGVAGDLAGGVDCAGLLRRWNGMVPPDVRLLGVRAAAEGFDARFSALSRRYAYRVSDDPRGPAPLRRYDTVGWRRPLDVDALRAASELLLGEHDFAAYCRRREGATTIRSLLRLDWQRADDGVLVATVEADAFCHSMVRSLVGALLAVGEGRRQVGWPADLLSRSTRADEVGVAPPHGLTLLCVTYPPDGELAARAAETRRLRSVPIGKGDL
jgi:tRNA pseudouridine38-40 synthase